nr:long-chain fatty acid--CoA ligase [Micromonospora sp. DSM 115978]
MTAGSSQSSVSSIPALLADRVRATPHAEALRYRDGGGWASMTWTQTQQRVTELAFGLIAVGVVDETRVAILSGTRVEWLLTDLAVLTAGGATTTVYPSSTATECAHIVGDSGSIVVIAEDTEQVAKLRSIRDRIPAVRHVVVLDEVAEAADGWVMTLDRLLALGRDLRVRDPQAVRRSVAAITPDRLATLIYTSGTTGVPKGVELVHDNWLYAAEAVSGLGVLRPDDLHFLWLPMSHSFGKVLEVAMIANGIPTAIDGRVERLAANLAELRPTIVAAAPRIFEKIHNTVLATVQRQGGIRLALFRWAGQVGIAVSRERQAGRRPRPALRWRYALADRLVFARLRDRFGGRIRYFIAGSAPLSVEIAEFFDAAGLTILEGYALTESSAASFVNRPETLRFGTVGPPLPGTEVSIAEDGEVLIRSRSVMRGYHGLPAETAQVLRDGWLRTGDIGELDEAGRLRITDRKKELIKTSGGKYVAPQYVEGRLKAACPYLSNVLVHGDRRNYCVALVTLDVDIVEPWASSQRLPTDAAELATHPRMRAAVQQSVDAVNRDLARHETIKAFTILPADFSVAGGELTPSLKLRRRHIEERYRDVLDACYSSPMERV